MSGRPKRTFRHVVDLTGDSESQPRAKRHSPVSGTLSTGLGGSSVYTSSPLRGQSSTSSSQPMSSSQTALYEDEVLDLTQDDDGPPRELYGIFSE